MPGSDFQEEAGWILNLTANRPRHFQNGNKFKIAQNPTANRRESCWALAGLRADRSCGDARWRQSMWPADAGAKVADPRPQGVRWPATPQKEGGSRKPENPLQKPEPLSFADAAGSGSTKTSRCYPLHRPNRNPPSSSGSGPPTAASGLRSSSGTRAPAGPRSGSRSRSTA